ncbi:pyridoxal phosphate-dependent aminotransferase [Sorangium sp. So ce362]|uniref:pyridoxal phosphate-dependent aminotransferase n=1 Tax=Sorangium sp. So ce362 TaxID=3133303 RepID=UPI003F5EF5D3
MQPRATASDTPLDPDCRPGAPPIDMALNHGTYCSERCADVMRRHDGNVALRRYPAADNGDLRRALAEDAGVRPENVLVANGSGPLLKACIPFLIENKIKRSAMRTLRFLLRRVAYPIITTRLTYSKVPASGVRVGLRCELLPLGPENGFALDVEMLASRLSRQDGLVYLCNPNNPTGNVLITRRELEPLLARFPESCFFIDEAYVHYLEDSPGTRMTDLVLRHPNLVVLRSFSFAHGLASVRVGYAVADQQLVAQMEARLTPHRVGQLATELAKASLQDRGHLGFVRQQTGRERARLMAAIGAHRPLEAFPSKTNFILCRARGAWSGAKVHDALLARGVKVKVFEPFGEERYDEYFRVTVGLPAENSCFIEQLDAVMSPRRAAAASVAAWREAPRAATVEIQKLGESIEIG